MRDRTVNHVDKAEDKELIRWKKVFREGNQMD